MDARIQHKVGSDVFGFAEKREKDQSGDKEDLKNDGEDYGAALEVTRAFFEFRIPF